MNKKHLLDQLNQLAWYLELDEANPFKVRALATAIDRLQSCDEDLIRRIIAKKEKLPGIGDGIITMMASAMDTGSIPDLVSIQSKYPKSIQKLRAVAGLGTKRIRLLWDELKVGSLEDLKRSIEDHQLQQVKGFGASLVAKIADRLTFVLENQGKLRLVEALEVAGIWMERLLSVDSPRPLDLFLGGSVARAEVIHDRIVIGSSNSPAEIQQALEKLNTPYQLRGDAIFEIQVSQCQIPLEIMTQTTVTQVINPILSPTDIQSLASYPPEYWEPSIATFLRTNPVPVLHFNQIKGTFHCHTSYSDGKDSIHSMANHAKNTLGLKYLAISDHSKTASYAGGMPEYIAQKQWREIDQLNDRDPSFRVFKSCEVDILSDGSVDYQDTIIDGFDFVIASVHGGAEGDRTERVLKALDHPKVRMIGHVTGRLLLERPAYPIDVPRVIQKSAKLNKIVEFNCNSWRMDLDWSWGQLIRETGMILAINTDAHSTDGLNDLRHGVQVARKFGIPPSQIINTWELPEVERYLGIN